MSNGPILSCSKSITTHSFDSKQPISLYSPHRGLINCATFNHTNKVIASCGQDGRIVLVSSQKTDNILAQFIFEPQKHSHNTSTFAPTNLSSINCCLFSPHSKYIAAGSVDSIIKIWQMKNHKDVYLTLRSHIGGVTSVSWTKNEEILASSSTNGDIFLHSVKTGSVVQQISLRGQDGINCLRFSENESDSRLAACTNSGSIMIWDLDSTKSARPSCTFQNPMKVSVTSLSFSVFHSALLVTASIDQNLTFYDIFQKKAVKTIATEQPLTAVNFHSDGHTLVAGGMYGGLFVYDLRKPQKPKEKLLGHQTAIKYIDFHKQRQTSSSYQGGSSSVSSSQHSNKESVKQKPRTIVVNGSLSKIPPKQKERDLNQQNYKKQELKKVKAQNIKQVQQVSGVTKITQIRKQLGNALTSNQQSRVTSFDLLPNPTVNTQLSSTNRDQFQTFKRNIENSINQKIQLLHLQIIRQFQIQQQQIKQLFQKKNEQQRLKDQYIKQLQQQNIKLKSNRY